MQWLSAAALILVLAGPCFAQQAGFRDLTTAWRAPDDHIPAPSAVACPDAHSTVSDGDQVPASVTKKPDEKLELTIAQLVPAELHLGDDFTATVQLKNIGTDKILIPWQPDGEQVTRISADGKQELYEVADVAFRLKTGDKKRPPLFLETEGALFAHPDDHASYLELEPGRWVTLKMKGSVICGLSNCPVEAQPDEHAILTAWWYQRVLTHRVEGCNENHGAYTIREVDSAPMAVVVGAPMVPSKDKDQDKDMLRPPAGRPLLITGMLPAGGRCARSQSLRDSSRSGK